MINVKIIYDIKTDTFSVEGNAKDPKKIVEDFIRTQVGAGEDKAEANKLDSYVISIALDPSFDTFTATSNCGNKGLRDGILMHFLKK